MNLFISSLENAIECGSKKISVFINFILIRSSGMWKLDDLLIETFQS